jgi:DNA-binding XRE family transcriptional regulator
MAERGGRTMVVMAKKKRKTIWARKLKVYRDGRGWTQARAAKEAGVVLRTWIAWENSQTVPSGPSAELLRLKFPDADLPQK